jgi:glutamate synthase domain-containing protein 3
MALAHHDASHGDKRREYMTNGTVVILGATGRNFGAGMSGGIAYVLDEDGSFSDTRCNKTGVDLEPVEERADLELLKTLIRKHVEYTGSPQGKWILENWAAMLPKFVKVFPHEFKRVLGIARAGEHMKISGAVVAAKSRLMQEGAR